MKDLQRIESIRDTAFEFLEDGITKQGTLDWSENTGEGTKKNCEEPIVLKGNYPIKWQEYCKVDDTNTGRFVYVVNKIK